MPYASDLTGGQRVARRSASCCGSPQEPIGRPRRLFSRHFVTGTGSCLVLSSSGPAETRLDITDDGAELACREESGPQRA